MGRRVAAALVLALFAAAPSVGAAATVRALPLPAGYTVDPESVARDIAFDARGNVYALTAGMWQWRLALRWADRHREPAFVPTRERYDDGTTHPAPTAIAGGTDGALVTVTRVYDGAMIRFLTSVDRWSDGATARWALPCVADDGGRVVAIDGRTVAITTDPIGTRGDPDQSDPRSMAAQVPHAYVFNDGRCTDLGYGAITAVRGNVRGGYLGYLNGLPAPLDVRGPQQSYRALRWIRRRRDDLGDGIVCAVTANGDAVGASGLPGRGTETFSIVTGSGARTYRYAPPHAMYWPRRGRGRRLFGDDERSVAWDINDAENVVGMLVRDGKHYAFRSRGSRVQLLDELPHPAGWRFESAYAIGRDGTIAGIGRRDDVPTVFLWHD